MREDLEHSRSRLREKETELNERLEELAKIREELEQAREELAARPETYGQESAYIEEKDGEAGAEEDAAAGEASGQKEKLRLLNENAELKARLESLRQEMGAMEQRLSFRRRRTETFSTIGL